MDRQIPTTKQEMLPTGVVVAKFDFTQTFRNQLFSLVRVLYHQYSRFIYLERCVHEIARFTFTFVKFLNPNLFSLLETFITNTDVCLTADPGVASSIPARSHSFVGIDHEIISTVILLPSADSFKKGCCQLQAKVCAQITG